MHKTIPEALDFAHAIPETASIADKVETVVCPPFTCLAAVADLLKAKGILTGAQNIYPEAKGAFTGEISPEMIRSIGCRYVILGHSERRHILGETNAFINQKMQKALEYELVPILCVGETLEERQKGKTREICETQLAGSLKDISQEAAAGMVIAYEPVWAIGTGVNASVQDAQETIQTIRHWVSQIYGQQAASAVRIQYGGSVKPENVREYMSQPDIDGALVGGAGLEPGTFLSIVKGAF
jgi:triosephosphate isomerase